MFQFKRYTSRSNRVVKEQEFVAIHPASTADVSIRMDHGTERYSLSIPVDQIDRVCERLQKAKTMIEQRTAAAWED